jgi:hypothetical protein
VRRQHIQSHERQHDEDAVGGRVVISNHRVLRRLTDDQEQHEIQIGPCAGFVRYRAREAWTIIESEPAEWVAAAAVEQGREGSAFPAVPVEWVWDR